MFTLFNTTAPRRRRQFQPGLDSLPTRVMPTVYPGATMDAVVMESSDPSAICSPDPGSMDTVYPTTPTTTA